MATLTKNLHNKIFYFSTLLFAFTLPLSRAAVSFFIIWFIILFITSKNYYIAWEQIKDNRVFHAMGTLFALLALSILWSDNKSEALNQIRLYSYWIIIPILAVSLKREWIPNIITAFLGGMFISEIISYGIHFEWWTFKDRTPDYPSPFMFHIHYSIFLATTAIILLTRLLSDRYTWKSKLPMLIFFLTSSGNLMISTGRTGQLALFVAIGVAAIIHYRLTFRSLLIFVTINTILFLGAYNTIDLFQKRIDMGISDIKHLQEGNFDTSWGLRAAFWITTKDIILKHPLLGVGIGDYKLGTIEALASNQHNFTKSTIYWCSNYDYHNQYLMIIGQIGLIGLGIMLWMYVELFKLTINNPELKEFSILGLTVFVVSSMTESLWTLQFPIILFIFIASISLASSNHNRKIKDKL